MKPRAIEWDLNGAALEQGTLDRIFAEASAPGEEPTVTIVIKRMSRHLLPRLIADYGDLIYRVCAELDRRKANE